MFWTNYLIPWWVLSSRNHRILPPSRPKVASFRKSGADLSFTNSSKPLTFVPQQRVTFVCFLKCLWGCQNVFSNPPGGIEEWLAQHTVSRGSWTFPQMLFCPGSPPPHPLLFLCFPDPPSGSVLFSQEPLCRAALVLPCFLPLIWFGSFGVGGWRSWHSLCAEWECQEDAGILGPRSCGKIRQEAPPPPHLPPSCRERKKEGKQEDTSQVGGVVCNTIPDTHWWGVMASLLSFHTPGYRVDLTIAIWPRMPLLRGCSPSRPHVKGVCGNQATDQSESLQPNKRNFTSQLFSKPGSAQCNTSVMSHSFIKKGVQDFFSHLFVHTLDFWCPPIELCWRANMHMLCLVNTISPREHVFVCLISGSVLLAEAGTCWRERRNFTPSVMVQLRMEPDQQPDSRLNVFHLKAERSQLAQIKVLEGDTIHLIWTPQLEGAGPDRWPRWWEMAAGAWTSCAWSKELVSQLPLLVFSAAFQRLPLFCLSGPACTEITRSLPLAGQSR